MYDIDNIIRKLEKLQFNDKHIPFLENQMLNKIEIRYGKDSSVYQDLLYLTRQGFWRPERGDPRGSASCPSLYQREYKNQISKYKNLLFTDLYGIKPVRDIRSS